MSEPNDPTAFVVEDACAHFEPCAAHACCKACANCGLHWEFHAEGQEDQQDG